MKKIFIGILILLQIGLLAACGDTHVKKADAYIFSGKSSNWTIRISESYEVHHKKNIQSNESYYIIKKDTVKLRYIGKKPLQNKKIMTLCMLHTEYARIMQDFPSEINIDGGNSFNWSDSYVYVYGGESEHPDSDTARMLKGNTFCNADKLDFCIIYNDNQRDIISLSNK